MKIKHQHFLFIANYFVIIFVISVFIGYIYHFKLKTDLLNVFEAKTLAQLETYHNANVSTLKAFTDGVLRLSINISQNSKLQNALFSHNLAYVQDFFDNQLEINDFITLWSVFDANGNAIMISTNEKGFANKVGKNFAERDYFQKVKTTKKPYISPVLTGIVTGENIFVFSAPILDNKNTVLYTINASVSMTMLQNQLGIKNYLTNNYNILLDRDGNILLENGKTLKNSFLIKNKLNQEKVVQDLKSGKKNSFVDEVNYKGEVVFAMGDKINSNLEIISYNPKIQYETQYQEIKIKIIEFYFYSIIFITILVFIVHRFWKKV